MMIKNQCLCLFLSFIYLLGLFTLSEAIGFPQENISYSLGSLYFIFNLFIVFFSWTIYNICSSKLNKRFYPSFIGQYVFITLSLLCLGSNLGLIIYRFTLADHYFYYLICSYLTFILLILFIIILLTLKNILKERRKSI